MKAIENNQVESEETLPKGWKWVRLGDVCSISTGTTPATNQPLYYQGNIPFVKTSEVVNNRITKAETFISQEAMQDYGLKLYSPSTILMAMYGQGKTRGQVAILDISAATTQNAAAIVPSSTLLPDYIWYWLRGKYEYLRQLGYQGDLSHLSLKYVKQIEIPLPPLKEQKQIVAILNDRLSAIEKARTAALAQLEAAKALPAAYLRQVFDRPEAQKWKRKKLGDVAILERGKFTPRPRNDSRYYNGAYPWIQTGDVERASKYVENYSSTLNENGLQVSRLFSEGTLVITIAANIGAVGILTFDSCMPDSLVGVTPLSNLSITEFLYYYLLYIREFIRRMAPQAAQANLSLTLLKPIEILLPSLSEQQEIASILSRRIEQAERLQRSLQDQLDAIEQLPAALLRQAFNGEL